MLEYIPETVYKVARQYAKNKQTIPINFIRVSCNQSATFGDAFLIGCYCSFTCTNCSEVSHTSTRWAFVIVTLNRRTCCWTPRRLCWNCAILVALSSCFRVSPMCHTSARATIERPNLSLVQLTTRQKSVSCNKLLTRFGLIKQFFLKMSGVLDAC